MRKPANKQTGKQTNRHTKVIAISRFSQDNNVSVETTRHQHQSGHHPIELHQQKSPNPGFIESKTPSNRNQTNLLQPHVLPDTSPSSNSHSLLNINSVLQDLQKLAVHAHSEINN